MKAVAKLASLMAGRAAGAATRAGAAAATGAGAATTGAARRGQQPAQRRAQAPAPAAATVTISAPSLTLSPTLMDGRGGDHASGGGRHVHGGLVGFQGDQGVVQP